MMVKPNKRKLFDGGDNQQSRAKHKGKIKEAIKEANGLETRRKFRHDKEDDQAEIAIDALVSTSSDDDEQDEVEFNEESDLDASSSEKEEEDDENEADVDPQQLRLKLAKKYLKELDVLDTAGDEGSLGSDAKDDDSEDQAAKRVKLQRDSQFLTQATLEASGRYAVKIAHHVSRQASDHKIHLKRGHHLAATCVAVSPDETRAVTGSKDKSLVLWDVETCTKLGVFQGSYSNENAAKAKGHTRSILAAALSYDCALIASGGLDQVVRVWDARISGSALGSQSKTNKSSAQVAALKGHRGAITGLAFRANAKELYSSSDDRTVKIWNLEDMAYVDTLFGHTAQVLSIDTLLKHRALTGARDGSLRLWKIPEDSQLVFRTSAISTDAVCMIDESNFLSGGDDGCLYSWNIAKRKPAWSVMEAHGGSNNWISSIAAARFSDLVASGSNNGAVRLWALNPIGYDRNKFGPKSMDSICDIPVPGFINGMVFGKSRRRIYLATGQEHRLGRWTRIPKSVNGIGIISLAVDNEEAFEHKDDEVVGPSTGRSKGNGDESSSSSEEAEVEGKE